LVLRPKNLITVKANFEFNGQLFSEIEVDLVHINRGRSGRKQRSDFDAKTVANFCETLLSGKTLKPIGEQSFGDEMCSYYKLTGKYGSDLYRLVACYCTDKPLTLGVITFFKENLK